MPPGDPAAFAAAVLSVLDDSDLAASLGAAAAARAASLPTDADATAAAIALYSRLAARRTLSIEGLTAVSSETLDDHERG